MGLWRDGGVPAETWGGWRGDWGCSSQGGDAHRVQSLGADTPLDQHVTSGGDVALDPHQLWQHPAHRVKLEMVY